MNRIERIEEGSVSRLLVEFSVPSIIAMLSQGVCGIMERIYAGNGAGAAAISGITLAFPVVALFMAFGMMIGTGGASLYAIRKGQGRTGECRKITRASFMMLAAVSIILSGVTALFLDEILKLSGAGGEPFTCARDYLEVLLLALPVQSVSFGMNNFLRAQGRPASAMTTILTASAGSIVLSPLFIFVLHMGVRGAALGYLSAQVLAAAHVLACFAGTPKQPPVPGAGSLPGLHVFGEIIVSGTGPFFMQLCAVAVSASFNRQLLGYGAEGDLYMFGIARCVSVFLLMPALAVSQAAQPLIGYSHGSRNPAAAWSFMTRAAAASVLVPAAGVLAVIMFPAAVYGLFAGHDIQGAAGFSFPLRIFVVMLPLAGLQVCAGGYFLATGRPLLSAMLTLSRQVLFLIPLLYIMPAAFGISGVWLAQPVSDAAAFIFASAALHIDRGGVKKYLRGIKEINTRHAQAKVSAADLVVETGSLNVS